MNPKRQLVRLMVSELEAIRQSGDEFGQSFVQFEYLLQCAREKSIMQYNITIIIYHIIAKKCICNSYCFCFFFFVKWPPAEFCLYVNGQWYYIHQFPNKL